jgi:hypothetical protein
MEQIKSVAKAIRVLKLCGWEVSSGYRTYWVKKKGSEERTTMHYEELIKQANIIGAAQEEIDKKQMEEYIKNFQGGEDGNNQN